MQNYKDIYGYKDMIDITFKSFRKSFQFKIAKDIPN